MKLMIYNEIYGNFHICSFLAGGGVGGIHRRSMWLGGINLLVWLCGGAQNLQANQHNYPLGHSDSLWDEFMT